MVLAGSNIKTFSQRTSHIFCFAHLIHNGIGKLVTNFSGANELVAVVKASTVKNKTRKFLFNEIGQSPEPILTRWGKLVQSHIILQ